MLMINLDKIPVEYRPISAIKYFIYTILFSLPVIGLIFVIIYSLSNSNINRKNFAKSFLIIYVILFICEVIFGLAGGYAYLFELFQ